MSDFEFVFSLYSLLLSFSLVALLTGLSRSLDAVVRKDAMKVGYLLPLLGAFVLLDLLSFWRAAWIVRESIEVDSTTLLAVSLFAGGYFLAANLVFPERPDKEDDLTDHYFRVRRLVMGLLLVLLACQLTYYSTVPALGGLLARPGALAWTAVLMGLMVATMVVRSRRLSAVLLILLVARYLYIYLV
jgi:hypothetical protein